MVRHIVWWTLKDEAGGRSAAENARRVVEASAMLRDVPSARSVEVSAQILPSATVPVQLALTSTHDDLAALEAYRVDPTHVKFASIIGGCANSRQCIDYILD